MGQDVTFKDLHRFYKSRDPHVAFPTADGQDPLSNKLASWSIKHRDREGREHVMPCTVRWWNRKFHHAIRYVRNDSNLRILGS